MIKERLVFVSDHDGTLTDADQEALHYDEIALDYLVEALGVSEDELLQLLQMAKAKIKDFPSECGWKRNGFIVAPASADHYIFNNVATEMVLEYLRSSLNGVCPRIPTESDQTKFMNQFFQTTSAQLAQVGSFYREGADEYIKQLSAAGDFVIVTNSSPDVVSAKLRGFLGERASDLRLVGNAKKYDVDPNWIGVVPEGRVLLPGFPGRGVYLQRRTYYETLSRIADGDIRRIAVCGDIPELDTLMVDYLGCRTALIEGGTTSSWERNYYHDGDPKRFGGKSLEEIADWMSQE